ncbi:MAG: NAD(P)-binding protein [Aquimonas sp.]|nr:NAD(P)-binding protein [Aquimonas sp.]
MIHESKTIAIVGAGLTAAALSRLLRAGRHPVLVFEKARGPGGRLSTRKTAHGRYNHGAAGLTGAELASVHPVLSAHWPRSDGNPFAMPSNECVRALLGDASVVYTAQVARLTRGHSGWNLSASDGSVLGQASTLLLTAPAPQSADLLQEVLPSWANQLRQAHMEPSWVVMVKASLPTMQDLTDSAPTGRWHRRKPLLGHPDCYVFEADRTWAHQHLEEDPRDIIADCLGHLGLGSEQIEEATAHRWRYARCVSPLASSHFWDPETRIGVAGDAFAGEVSQQGILRALHSAAELASAVLEGTHCS